MKTIASLVLGTLVLAGGAALAADQGSSFTPRERADALYSQILMGEVIGAGKARADTLYLLGGPDLGDGDFQHDIWESFPMDEGWYGVDITQRTEEIWHIDTYNAELLDELVVPNHAMWCGTDIPSCGGGDPEGGYGNGYNEYLDWYGVVPNPGSGTTVNLTARLNYDNEPGYDFLTLEVDRSSGLDVVQTWNGDNRVGGVFVPVDVDETFTVQPADYVGPASDQIHLRWHFVSDTGWSDEDCLWPTEGAAQVDNIQVTLNGTPWTLDDFEPGSWVNWQIAYPVGVGQFAWTWPELEDIDACRTNHTPQWGFLDDGLVQPGTGGYLCTTWCYGYGGYIVNPEGGLAGPDFHIHNEVWSPVIAWPDNGYDGALFAFDVFRHESLAAIAPGVFYLWHVRSTTDPLGADDWSGWLDRNFVYYGGPDYIRHREIVTDLLVAGREHVQLALGVLELGWVWGYVGTDGYPAPYYDNVAFAAYEFGGAAIATREIDIAQDNFPEIGTIDFGNPGANSVRFDGAMNISPSGDLRNDPADSICFDVTPVRAGSILNDRPQLWYHLKANPIFDGVRTSGLPNVGWVYGDSTRTATGGIVPDRWNFDLPDTGFFFPGDVVHYFILAEDNLGGDIATTALPGDTTCFSVFPGDSGYVPMRYPTAFTVRALPGLNTLAPGDHPPILLLNDFGIRGGENEWSFAFQNLGYHEGTDFDLYHVNGPSSGVGNGIGGRGTATQISGYETVLYTCGDLSTFTISNGDFQNDAGDDVSVLDTWLRFGNKNILLCGDDLVFDLAQSGIQTLSFLNNWISVNLVDQDLRPLIENQASPVVKPIPGNSVFFAVEEWFAYGGCLGFNTFDAVTVAGSAEMLAEFTNPDGGTGYYSFAAAVLHDELTYNNDIIYLPYDFMYIYSRECGSKQGRADRPTRVDVLEEILFFFGHIGSSPVPVGVPETEEFSVRNFPNPFNPITRIEYNLPQKGPLSIRIYNLRGELVRTLIDEVVERGPGFVTWDGTDRSGQGVASGVYFCQTKAVGRTDIRKMTIVR